MHADLAFSVCPSQVLFCDSSKGRLQPKLVDLALICLRVCWAFGWLS
jgi:hypothetical protein